MPNPIDNFYSPDGSINLERQVAVTLSADEWLDVSTALVLLGRDVSSPEQTAKYLGITAKIAQAATAP